MTEPQEQANELQQHEAWLARFTHPQPSVACLARIRQSVARELQNPYLVLQDGPPLPSHVPARLKAAVRTALAAEDPARTRRWPILRLYPALASAAMIALMLGTFALSGARTTTTQGLEPFVVELAFNNELAELEADIVRLELRSQANDYLLLTAEDEPDDFRRRLEQIARPDLLDLDL